MIHEQLSQAHSENDCPFCRARILYMEDDPGLGSLLKKSLERLACRVELARDGQEGLEIFANNTYDVVIADYNMPTVNGMEVLGKLKDLVPVIILTGHGDEMIAVDAMKLGAADYVIKDVNGNYLKMLPASIDRVLEKRQLIKDRSQARAELQASEARYRAIVEDQTEFICRFNHLGNLTFANAAFCRYFGIRQADIGFQNIAKILSRKVYRHVKGILKTLTFQNPSAMDTSEIKNIDGKVHWLQWTNRAIFVDGKLKEYQIVGRNITELKRVEAALRASEEKNSALLSAIPDPILRIDRYGTCVDLRFKEGQVLKLSSDLIGKNIADFFPPDVVMLMMEQINKTFMEGTSQVFQFTIKQEDRVSEQEARLVFAEGNEVFVILRDITERNKLEQKLQYLSIHDSMTGLYNRAYFEEEMRRLESGRYHPVGIVMCDVDGLKIINDNLGHGMGDELLKLASNIILQAFRVNDAVARIGGDEFAVLLPNATQTVVEEAGNRLKKAVAEYNKATPELFLSISVGVAVSSHVNINLGEVFEQADKAMYSDKMSRRRAVYDAIVQTLKKFQKQKDGYSKEHADRVKTILHHFGRTLKFPKERLAVIDLFAEYHDIGKVALPEKILASKEGVSSEEYVLIKRHCEVGQRIALSTLKLHPVADWILKHHEWWNGTGYPLGIREQEIPLECRMLAIVDAYERMTGSRHSGAVKSSEEALAELRSCAGTQFDPELIEIFVRNVMGEGENEEH